MQIRFWNRNTSLLLIICWPMWLSFPCTDTCLCSLCSVPVLIFFQCCGAGAATFRVVPEPIFLLAGAESRSRNTDFFLLIPYFSWSRFKRSFLESQIVIRIETNADPKTVAIIIQVLLMWILFAEERRSSEGSHGWETEPPCTFSVGHQNYIIFLLYYSTVCCACFVYIIKKFLNHFRSCSLKIFKQPAKKIVFQPS